MPTERRDFLKLTAGLALTPALAACSGRDGTPQSTADADLSRDDLVAHFRDKGFFLLPRHPLITGHPFNAGLRFDEEPAPQGGGKAQRVQACGRVEDIAKRGETGVLAYFHIVNLRTAKPAYRGEILTEALNYFGQRAGLKRERFLFASADWIDPYSEDLASLGFAPEQIVMRPQAEVMAKGDGSGLYRPAGHPMAPEVPTVSLHYALTDEAARPGLPYPFPGYLELGEFSLKVGPWENEESESCGIGLERVRLVRGFGIDGFEDSRMKLLAALETEAAQRGVALPEAYAAFAAV